MSGEDKIKNLFKEYDTNHNGVLDKSEGGDGLTEGIGKGGDNKSKEEVGNIANEAIEQFDLNKNGTIELDEFTELINYLVNEKGLTLD